MSLDEKALLHRIEELESRMEGMERQLNEQGQKLEKIECQNSLVFHSHSQQPQRALCSVKGCSLPAVATCEHGVRAILSDPCRRRICIRHVTKRIGGLGYSAEAQALRAIVMVNYDEAVVIYSNIISLVEQTVSDNDMPKLLGQRAACFLLVKKFEEVLVDSNRAILFDTINIVVHIQKIKALVNLNKVNKAEHAIRIGRASTGNASVYDELEKTIPTPWLNLGHATVKFVTTILVGIAAGLLTSIFSNYSSWKLAILAMIFCLVALFLNVYRLFPIFNFDIRTLKFDYIWHVFCRATATMPSTQTTTQHNRDHQLNSN